MTAKDGLGFLGSDLWVYGLAVRIFGVLLHQLTVRRHWIVHDGLETTATEIRGNRLGLAQARLFHNEKVIGDKGETGSEIGSHCFAGSQSL